MKASELRELSLDELKEKLVALRKEQFQNRLKMATGTLEKSHVIKPLRRSIAKIKTIITEKSGVSDAS